jgi:predicted dehydrogenase
MPTPRQRWRVPWACRRCATTLRTVYIASNHASHVPYALQALARGIDVYIEKPVAVSREQLRRLVDACAASGARIHAGYNRPFAGATRALRALMPIDAGAGLTLQCFVSGHRLGADHWYRRPDEGTRVCGNLGHWLDLLIHVLAWRGLPDRLDISLTCADDSEPDDNLSVAVRSDRADLFVVTLGSRCEPYEGIRETIDVQHGETIACIDDFRTLTVRQGARLVKRHFWPKDVGHRLAVLQPWGEAQRPWSEVLLSTLLMLQVADMVRDGRRQSVFSLRRAAAWLADPASGPPG